MLREAIGQAGDESGARWAALLRLMLVPGFALLTSLGAHVAVPLPPDGVPMTMQTLAVLLAAMCLGPRLGAASMGLYVLMGIVGASVFAEGEKGAAAILGQTGGYLVGFVACQPVVGWIVKRRDGSVRGWGALVVAVLAAEIVIFGVGVPWLAVVNGFGIERALEGGLYPFLPGAVIKGAIAVLIGRVAVPWASRRLW
ncbi:MAG: biotin transporter BioY [Phycisphaeraceae bacterium]|nr:biotin transporter BioY [Phycisphaeraceae bacterium]MCW5762568.1 biotin transporter BioY [Phycisphaeraceae bacterium]